MSIYMVRHGQDTDNENGILNGRRDTELTDLGKRQAKIVSKKLGDCKCTVYIGDEYESDVLFGQKLGCHTIFVNTGMDKNKASEIRPDLSLNMVKDLLDYI